MLLDPGFSEFALATEDPIALERFSEITSGRPMSVVAFEGPATASDHPGGEDSG